MPAAGVFRGSQKRKALFYSIISPFLHCCCAIVKTDYDSIPLERCDLMRYTRVLAILCALSLQMGMTAYAAGQHADIGTPASLSDKSLPPGPPPDGKMAPPDGKMMPPPGGGQGFQPPDHVTQGTAKTVIAKNDSLSDRTYTSSGDDENALRVSGARVSLSNVKILKSGGTSSSTEGGDFYGMNAAFLATDKAQVKIRDSAIESNAKNGNALFSYGRGTAVEARNVKITTHGDNSGGLQTTGSARMDAQNVTVVTEGNSSAAIRSDRGGGNVHVKKGSFRTAGYGSPAIYCTAQIAVENASLAAENSEAAVIEGKNSIALKNCTLEGNMADTRPMGDRTIEEENVHGVMLYQSMSGDAEPGKAVFSMEGGSLTAHRGDLFYVTNTECAITLKKVVLKAEDSSGLFLRVNGNDGERGWGRTGANGGKCTLVTENQEIAGDIEIDTLSSLDMTLGKGSRFTGSINCMDSRYGTAADSHIAMTVAKGAVWTLDNDSTVTTLKNEGQINLNGYQLTVLSENSKAGQQKDIVF